MSEYLEITLDWEDDDMVVTTKTANADDFEADIPEDLGDGVLLICENVHGYFGQPEEVEGVTMFGGSPEGGDRAELHLRKGVAFELPGEGDEDGGIRFFWDGDELKVEAIQPKEVHDGDDEDDEDDGDE